MTRRVRWRAVSSLAVFGGLALVAGAAIAPAGAATTTAVATATVNIRSGASTSTKIVGGLVRGQRINVTGTASAGWVKVRFNRKTAYVYAAYLNRTGKKLPAGPTKISASGI